MFNCILLTGGRSSRMGEDKTFLPFKGYTFFETVLLKIQKFISTGQCSRIIVTTKNIDKFIEFYNSLKKKKKNFNFSILKISNSFYRFSFKNYFLENIFFAFDIMNTHSSLIGLYSGLLLSEMDINLILATDMPFIKEEIISFLINVSAYVFLKIDFYDNYRLNISHEATSHKNILYKDITHKEKAVIFKNKTFFEPFPGIYHKSIIKDIKKTIDNNNFKINYLLKSIKTLSIPINNIKTLDPDFKTFININDKNTYNNIIR